MNVIKNTLNYQNTVSFKRVAFLWLVLALFMSPSHATYKHKDKCENIETIPLLLEDHTQVGVVKVIQNKKSLKIKFKAKHGWKIKKTHLAVESALGSIPTDYRGNPKLRKFPHKTKHRKAVDSVTHYVSTRNWAIDTELFIAAHADVEHVGGHYHNDHGKTQHHAKYSKKHQFKARINSYFHGEKSVKYNSGSYKSSYQKVSSGYSKKYFSKKRNGKSYKKGRYCKNKKYRNHKKHTHSAWAKGNPFYGDKKAYYFTFKLKSCKPQQPGVVQFDNDLYTVNEDAGVAVVTLVRTGNVSSTASVVVSTFDGTAQEGLDYGLVNEIITFAPNQTMADIEIPVIDDVDDEEVETINVQLSDAQGATLGDPVNAVVEIIDNDEAPQLPDTISFSSVDYDVNEGDGVAVITVVRSGNLVGEASVNFTTMPTSFPNGNATPNADYISAAGTLVFADGQASATFEVTIIDDRVTQPFEQKFETLQLLLDLPFNADLVEPSSAILTIEDNDINN